MLDVPFWSKEIYQADTEPGTLTGHCVRRHFKDIMIENSSECWWCSYHVEDCGLVGGDVVVARQGVVGVVHVDGVRVLQLPLPPGPLQPLPTPLPLHVRPERESGTT